MSLTAATNQQPEFVLAHGLIDAFSDPIKSIETFYVRPRWLFVRVETQKGIVGWGEATLEGNHQPAMAERCLIPHTFRA
jgi:L-alanine-DL-glutamate epimerase-like enolase superfamily enzyme